MKQTFTVYTGKKANTIEPVLRALGFELFNGVRTCMESGNLLMAASYNRDLVNYDLVVPNATIVCTKEELIQLVGNADWINDPRVTPINDKLTSLNAGSLVGYNGILYMITGTDLVQI